MEVVSSMSWQSADAEAAGFKLRSCLIYIYIFFRSEFDILDNFQLFYFPAHPLLNLTPGVLQFPVFKAGLPTLTR